MPSVRRRLVSAKVRSTWRMSIDLSAVSWWTITSGSASATARATASASSPSAMTGRAPSARSRSCLDGVRVMPMTSWPRATSWGTRRSPRAPEAPATKTFMVGSFLVIAPNRRDGPPARDSAYFMRKIRSNSGPIASGWGRWSSFPTNRSYVSCQT